MADKVITTNEDHFFNAYGDDYATSVSSEIAEVYGPKVNLFHNDREVRIAFGRLYPHRFDAETVGFRPRYSVAVYMPILSAIDLYGVLRGALISKGMLPADDLIPNVPPPTPSAASEE
jgi:hypothetical protein